MNNFADQLLMAIEQKRNPSVIGLDTDFTKIPQFIKDKHEKKYGKTFEAVAISIVEFNKYIIEAVKDIAPAVKIQMAFYEMYGQWGVWAFEETVKMSKEANLIVIEDGKRNDIGNTATAYANGHLGKVDLFGDKKPSFNVDCLTVSPYLGEDSLKPFVKVCQENGKGIFILVKTSNPSSKDLQDLECNDEKVYEILAEKVNTWGKDVIGKYGYSSIGAVVGATFPDQAKTLRKLMPRTIFLVPGYGAQGATADDITHSFNDDGKGAIVNSSRGIIFAYLKKGNEKDFALAAREAATKMKDDITRALKKVGKF